MHKAPNPAVQILLAGALGAAGGLAVPTVAHAAQHPAHGRLLPVPAVAAGQQLTVTAVDVTPSGVVGGSVRVTTTAPDGSQSTVELPQRWRTAPRGGWQRQQLAVPAGATSGTVSGLTDAGEPAGTVTVGGAAQAVRWTAAGAVVPLGGARSATDAAGPSGPWGVSTLGADFITGEAELVAADGTRTALRGTPPIDGGYRRTVSSVGGPDTAVVWVYNGFGQGINARPVLWKGGATVALPVLGVMLLGPACVSKVQADGSVVASGFSVEPGGHVRWRMVRHTGGVPGTDVALSDAVLPAPPQVGGIACEAGRAANVLAADGGIAGYVADAAGRRSAAYWSAADVLTVVPLAAGESSATGVAAAGGGRMVIRSEREDGSVQLSLWQHGVRTTLRPPAGWTVTSVVEWTGGLLVANVRDAAGTVRPAVWRTA